MITAVHAVIYTKKADAVRKFFKNALKLKNVDAGDGWLIFALPPAELGVHPTKGAAGHELYFLCDDIKSTVADLKKRRVKVSDRLTDAGWGLLTYVTLPDRSRVGLYEPRHPSPLSRPSKKKNNKRAAASRSAKR
jgi:predicted enzyme related to lactoylglutathione lyase